MNKFNKLYNLILQSIISQNKISRAILLADRQDHQKIENFLNQLAAKGNLQNKIADFLAKFFASEDIIETNDPRIEKVITIFRRQPNIDINQNNDLDHFLFYYKKYIERQQNKKVSQNLIATIDECLSDTFTQKEVDDKVKGGLVIYKVDDSEAGMKAVREIVDTEWGKYANPWCLVAREDVDDDENDMEQAWYYWNQYNAYPKHIAFQNGHLLAFCANDDKQIIWWDREDSGTEQLVLNDGQEYKTRNYQWSQQQKKAKLEKALAEFRKKYQLRFNQQTQKYDYSDGITIKKEYIVNGHFPVKFGRVGGNFSCEGCEDLRTLQGAPEIVGGYFNCFGCSNLTTLQGGPKKVKSYICGGNDKITNLKGVPEYIDDLFRVQRMNNLETLDYMPKTFKRIHFDGCDKLSTKDKTDLFILRNKGQLTYNQQTDRWDCEQNEYGEQIRIYQQDIIDGHFPVKFGVMRYGFSCSGCRNLTTLQGGPTFVERIFNCSWTSIKNLKGAPELSQNAQFDCKECVELESLQGAPYYAQYFICSTNPKLKSLKGSPKRIGRELKCFQCRNLTSLQSDIDDSCQFELNACSCPSLTTLKGAPKGARLVVRNCNNLVITKEDRQQIRQIRDGY